ncbi:MAG: hypothetical protein ACK5SX_15200 [Sandaracinobacter sp.]
MTSEEAVEKALADGARDGAVTGVSAVVEQQIAESAAAFGGGSGGGTPPPPPVTAAEEPDDLFARLCAYLDQAVSLDSLVLRTQARIEEASRVAALNRTFDDTVAELLAINARIAALAAKASSNR